MCVGGPRALGCCWESSSQESRGVALSSAVSGERAVLRGGGAAREGRGPWGGPVAVTRPRKPTGEGASTHIAFRDTECLQGCPRDPGGCKKESVWPHSSPSPPVPPCPGKLCTPNLVRHSGLVGRCPRSPLCSEWETRVWGHPGGARGGATLGSNMGAASSLLGVARVG